METIKSSKEIDLIFKNGKFISLPFLNLIYYSDEKKMIKGNVAFIAGKKHGNAVWRNKSKRILRELYKQISFKNNFKILLIAKKGIKNYKFEDMVKAINEIY